MEEGDLGSLLSEPPADCESSISSLDSLNYEISNDKEIILEPVSSSDEEEIVDTPGNVDSEKVIHLYHHRCYCMAIKSMAAFFARVYWCEDCYIAYNNKSDHHCRNKCSSCYHRPPCKEDGMETEGWSDGCKDEMSKERYLNEVTMQEGIELDPLKINRNLRRHALAKEARLLVGCEQNHEILDFMSEGRKSPRFVFGVTAVFN
uniref:Uncharacterized protein n=1 Tax=Romanomermis culicivorax TaxID=13658 RepID=A0A915JCZ6_ROMCU